MQKAAVSPIVEIYGLKDGCKSQAIREGRKIKRRKDSAGRRMAEEAEEKTVNELAEEEARRFG